MQTIWKLQGNVKFRKVGTNLFIVEFQDVQDLQKVQDGTRPWTFDQNLLCITNYDRRLSPQQIIFNKEPIWVQLHNIPLSMMNHTYGEKIGKIIGEILDIDVDQDDMGWDLTFELKHRLILPNP